MRRSSSWRSEIGGRLADDRGSAALEFITAGVLLLVPLIYLVVTMSVLQAATFATEGAARAGVREFVLASTGDEAEAALMRSVDYSLADFGISRDDARIEVTCTPAAAQCLTRESLVTVTIRVDAALPLIPSFTGGDLPATIPVEARATQRVSTFAALTP